MDIIIRSSAHKDVKKLSKTAKRDIEKLIREILSAKNITELINVKKIKGHKNAYRIRLNEYRIGFFLKNNNTIILSRILHRKDIYRYFP